MAGNEENDIPEAGAVFTFGRSRFADNQPSHFFIRNDPIIAIACGDEHTALVCQNGRVFVFGSNDYGQLGLGHTKPIVKPSCVKLLKPFSAKIVACGKGHTLVATNCGRLFVFGSNSDGQLGLGDTTDRQTPTMINLEAILSPNITALAAGCSHSALLTDDGILYTWGSNADGQCGQGDDQALHLPTKLSFSESIISISCGYYHTAFISSSGVYSMGEGDSGKLGLTSTDKQTTPQKVDIEGTFSSVVCGGSHTILLTDKGEVYTFGSNFSGQLGQGSTPVVMSVTQLPFDKPIIAIACGESHSAFLNEDGELYTCGDTRHGKLCLDELSGTSLATPTLIASLQLYRVCLVSCGGCHTMVVAKTRTDNSDADVVGQIKEVSALPPLKVRKPTTEVNNSSQSPTEEANSPEHTNGSPGEEEIKSVAGGNDALSKSEENEDNKSNTESSINVEDEVTSPIEDIYSEIQQVDIQKEADFVKSPKSDKRVKKELLKSDSMGDVVEKPRSRIQKFFGVFRSRKSSLVQSPDTDGVFITEAEKVGNEKGSKACTIL